MTKSMTNTNRLVLSALFVALGVIIPQIFHMFGLGSVFLPMHIPVILCGFICGPYYGLISGVLTVFLSSTITGMPPMMPVGAAMIFELAAYAFVAGLMYRKTKKIYFSLIVAMIVGRVVSIAAKYIIYSLIGNSFAMVAILTDLFVTAWPGIAIQILAIPAILALLRRYKLIA